MQSEKNMDKCYGALLGVLVGDAAGAPLEFYTSGLISEEVAKSAMKMPGGGKLRIGPGQITDDGELTLSLAHALIGQTGQLPLERIAASYTGWHNSRPFDIGNTTIKAFSCVSEMSIEKRLEHVLKLNSFSEANGGLMRIIPMALWTPRLEDTPKNARMDSLLSHPNPVCQDCNALYCLAVGVLIRNGSSADALNAVENFIKNNDVNEKVKGWFEDSKGELSQIDCTRNIGHVKHAFTLAFHFLRREVSFKDAIRLTLMRGGDTDTNAAIVGGMMGALHGKSSVPWEIKFPVLNFDPSRPGHLGHKRSAMFSACLYEKLVDGLVH